MKHVTKFIAALAVMASFSALAADPIEGLADVADLAGATELIGEGDTSAAAILQTATGSFAAIEQTGTNAAAIIQLIDDSRASIVQTGENNAAIIIQQ